MIIHVAAEAFGIESKVSELFIPDALARNEFGHVTILAGLLCMRPGKDKARYRVVELIFIESYELVIQTMMIVVTNRTAFSAGFSGSMKSLVLIDAGFHFGMTGQAFGIGNLVAELMAFRTV